MNVVNDRRHFLDVAATSLGILAVAVTSGAEVLLFLHRFGTTDKTDGVFAAFALYSLVTVFAQILRTSAVPLVTGDDAPVRPADFAASVVAMGGLVVVVLSLSASALAGVLARSLTPDGQALTASSLRILAPAMALQIVAAGMAVVGARRGRLRAVGVAYIVANVVGLVAFLATTSAFGERSLAWCVLIGSVVLVPCLLPATGRSVVRPNALRPLIGTTALLVQSAATPVTFVALYPITIALAGPVQSGEITRFAFAYTVCSYLPGLTSVALSMTDITELSATDRSATVRGHVALRSARWSSFGIAPVVAAAAAVGPRLFERLDAGQAGAGDLGHLFVLLAPWLAATVLLWSTLPALLAETRGVGLLPYVPTIAGVHVAATIVGRALWDFDGVVVALCAAPLAFAFVSFWRTGVVSRLPAILLSVAEAALVGVVVYAALTPFSR